MEVLKHFTCCQMCHLVKLLFGMIKRENVTTVPRIFLAALLFPMPFWLPAVSMVSRWCVFHRGERLREKTRAYAFDIPMARMDLAWVSGKAICLPRDSSEQ